MTPPIVHTPQRPRCAAPAALAVAATLSMLAPAARAGVDAFQADAQIGPIHVQLQRAGDCPGCAAPALQLLPGNDYLDAYIEGGGSVPFLNGPLPRYGSWSAVQVAVSAPVPGGSVRLVDQRAPSASSQPWSGSATSTALAGAERSVSAWAQVNGPATPVASDGGTIGGGMVSHAAAAQTDSATGWTYVTATTYAPSDTQPYSAWSQLNLWISPHTQMTLSADVDLQASITGHARATAGAVLLLSQTDVADPTDNVLSQVAGDALTVGFSNNFPNLPAASHRTLSISFTNTSDQWVLRALQTGTDARGNVDPLLGPLPAVPEPATPALWLAGAGLLAVARRLRRQSRREA